MKIIPNIITHLHGIVFNQDLLNFMEDLANKFEDKDSHNIPIQ